ncbi:MAG: hypothetical protein KF781_04760 [Chitinophagaceae bacterium]|nr:hypothetical protein [Chitinophagaceae bacterium]MCW5904604.1 hypothetical protein [Chitinophagaceae bacterium]
MKLSFRQRLFLYFAILFTVFTIGIAILEHSREKLFKTEALEEKLDVYTDILQAAIPNKSQNFENDIKAFQSVLPSDLRITIISLEGKVLYDNTVKDFLAMENHSNRIEIKLALQNGKGTDIRESVSNHHPYLYYAKKNAENYIRVALPYNIQLRQFLKADNLFLYFLLVLFLLSIFFIHRITLQFGASIKKLRNFALHPTNNNAQFNEDELGEIGERIAENYRLLDANKKSLSLEKQKLLQHIHISQEGICFVSSLKKVEFHNSLFIQYLNQLTDKPKANPEAIFEDYVFSPLHQFILNENENYFESQIKSHGKVFALKANIFDDKSFEIILTDITQQEKTKQLKQEMTGNIAHELRTPITSIRGYLETVLEQPLTEQNKQHFIQQAYLQTLNLSELIKDMSIIAKMEEAPNSFEFEKVNIEKLLERILDEENIALTKKNIHLNWQLPNNITINGNPSLLNSIFRNLIENSIRYAGENININISVFNEDNDYYYFSFYDTGIGVENEEYLNRLFERFYRVQEGRTRDTGGSGLGLSIVKNAILFHKGTITAKNRKDGGLEFIFNLHK